MCREIGTIITGAERLLVFQFRRHFGLPPAMDALERTTTPTVVIAAPIAVHLAILPHSPGLLRRQSPCFVEAMDDEFAERPRDALIEAQSVLIDRYCMLTLQGVFRTSVSDLPPLLCTEPNSHPIQDPTGALFLALLVVRKNRPRGDCWMSRPCENRLQIQYRLYLAALITVCQKLCNSHFPLNLETFLQYLYKQFLYHGEMRSFASKKRQLCDEFCEMEIGFLTSEPLHTLLADNPQTIAEFIIGDLYAKGGLSLSNAKVFRGSTFFLLGACAMNREDDVLEILSRRYGDRAIGQACVLVLIVLLTVRGIPLAESSVEKHEQFTLPNPDEKLDLIAVTILQNCLGKCADQLRVGPYRVEVLLSEPPHLVQLLLRPDVLKQGLVVLEGRLLKELV